MLAVGPHGGWVETPRTWCANSKDAEERTEGVLSADLAESSDDEAEEISAAVTRAAATSTSASRAKTRRRKHF